MPQHRREHVVRKAAETVRDHAEERADCRRTAVPARPPPRRSAWRRLRQTMMGVPLSPWRTMPPARRIWPNPAHRVYLSRRTGTSVSIEGLREQVFSGALGIAVRTAPLENVRTVRTVGAPAVTTPEFVDGLPMIRSGPVGLADHRLVVPVRVTDLRGALGQPALRRRCRDGQRPGNVHVNLRSSPRHGHAQLVEACPAVERGHEVTLRLFNLSG